MRRAPLSAFLVLALCFAAPRIVGAQTPTAGPDVVIVVFPQGERYGAPPAITVDYVGRVTASAIETDVRRLAHASGWLLTRPVVASRALTATDDATVRHEFGQSTEARLTAPNAQFFRNYGVWLQPFVEAFHRYREVEIWYWIRPGKDFSGLREYNSPSVSIQLRQDSGPIRYLIENHELGGPVPVIPSSQAVASQSTRRRDGVAVATSAQPSTGSSPLRMLLPVLGGAVAAGAVVFVAIRLWALRRNRSDIRRKRANGPRIIQTRTSRSR